MTAIEAKKLTLEVWLYIKNHARIRMKVQLPKRLYNKIKDLMCDCPLCDCLSCDRCPLHKPSSPNCYYYTQWLSATTKIDRQEAAGKIIELVEAWKPECK